MKSFFKKYRNEIMSLLFLSVVNIFMILIFNTFLLSPDEYNYSHIAWTNIDIDCWSKLFDSLKSIYINWSGRLPVLGMSQFLIWQGVWLYKILNFIIFTVFIILLCKVTNRRFTIFNATFAVFCLAFTIRAFAEKFLWLTGSVNYLWTVTLMLIVIKFYYDIVIEKKDLSIIKGIIFCVISFFAGWSHENVVFYLGSFIIVLGLYKLKEFLKYDLKTKILIILNIVFFGIGVILLVASPGNFSRLDSGNTISFISIIRHICHNFWSISNLIAIFIVSFFVLIFSIEESETGKVKEIVLNEIIIFFIPVVISLIPMLFISEFPERSMLVYEAIFILTSIYNYNFVSEKKALKKIVLFLVIIMTITIFGKFGKELNIAEEKLASYKNIVDKQIEIAQKNNYKDAYLTRLDNEDINDDSGMLLNYSPISSRDGVINLYMSIYYKFDSIVALKDDEYLVSIKLAEPIKGAKNYKLINVNDSNEIIENISDEETNLVEFVVKKEQLKNYKIDFLLDDIKNKIESVKLITNIDIQKECMEITEINYNDIVLNKEL